MTQHLHTICLRSLDAKRLEEGTYQWTLRAPNFNMLSGKAFLASVELPMSQWSIEGHWNRIYCIERLFITAERRRLTVREHVPRSEVDSSVDPWVADAVTLPLHLNRIVKISSTVNGVRIEMEEAHGLSGPMFDCVAKYEEHVKIIASGVDVIDLSIAWSEERLTVVSDRVIQIRPRTVLPAFEKGRGGYLHVPSPPTPDALANALTAGLQAGAFGRRISVSFDTVDCTFKVSMAAYPGPYVTQVRLTVGGDALATLMGYSLNGTSRTFTRRPLDPKTVGYASTQGRTFLQQHVASEVGAGDAVPLDITGDASALFGYAQLRPGWYAPSQRIYSTSAPMRLTDEWELQFARFFFPQDDKPPGQPGLVFTDPLGVNRIAVIRPGLYTAHSIANYLQHMMNQDADGYAFAVVFQNERFTFKCHSKHSKHSEDAEEGAHSLGLAFSIHFTHPRSVDPVKFGFEAALLEGSDQYVSSESVHEPKTPFGRLTNLYSVSEVQGQRKFCIRPTGPPSVIGIAESYDSMSHTLRLRCVTPGNDAVAHGIPAGSVVTVGASGFVASANDQRESAQSDVRHASIPKGIVTLGVVTRGTESDGVTTIDVDVSPAPWVHTAVLGAQCMTITLGTAPCSFCFVKRLDRNVGGERLGFAPTTIQWGKDGIVNTRKLRIPPFISTGSHNLDHVDYVLLRIRESSKSTLMQHETNGEAISIFGKVVLNPSYRHERHLPVEVSFSGGDRLDTITIDVLNPDKSPYHFHDATWSLSLSFAS